MENEYITVSEAMKVLGVKTRQPILNLINSGRLKAINISSERKKIWRICLKSLNEL